MKQYIAALIMLALLTSCTAPAEESPTLVETPRVDALLTCEEGAEELARVVLDSQSGTAGVETRLESFIDIIRLKEGML